MEEPSCNPQQALSYLDSLLNGGDVGQGVSRLRCYFFCLPVELRWPQPKLAGDSQFCLSLSPQQGPGGWVGTGLDLI